jgi:hypothetical protein
MNKILVAFDYYAPHYPLRNNQNFNQTIPELARDTITFEFFNNLSGFECVPSSFLKEMDYFIYPINLGLHGDNWINRPEIDLFATTNMSIHTFNGIRGRNGFLLLDLGNESVMDDRLLDMIHDYLKQKDIPLRKVILQTGNANGENHYKDYCFRKQINRGINIACLEYFEWMCSRLIIEHKKLNREVLPKNIDFTKIKKTFLCLNRIHRRHRVNLFLLWNFNNLVEDTYYTMSNRSNLPIEPENDDIWRRMLDWTLINKFEISEEYIDKIYDTLPLKIDEFIEASEMAGLYSAVDPYYQTSLISVVTETNFENNDVFNTEKIFKPIVHRHPFILVGPYKTLARLKEMGYKTFSDFWDESYDDIEDPTERLLKIVEVSKEIHSWDDIKKKQFFYKSMSITTHNYDVLSTQYPNNMRKNFWHRLRDYVMFEQDKDKKI